MYRHSPSSSITVVLYCVNCYTIHRPHLQMLQTYAILFTKYDDCGGYEYEASNGWWDGRYINMVEFYQSSVKNIGGVTVGNILQKIATNTKPTTWPPKYKYFTISYRRWHCPHPLTTTKTKITSIVFLVLHQSHWSNNNGFHYHPTTSRQLAYNLRRITRAASWRSMGVDYGTMPCHPLHQRQYAILFTENSGGGIWIQTEPSSPSANPTWYYLKSSFPKWYQLT